MKWADRNIDVTTDNNFAVSPFHLGASFFSWGNIDAHNPTSPSSFIPWNWGSVNQEEPYYEGQPYGDTLGSALESDIPVNENYDAARAILGSPCRIPSNGDFAELFENIIFINEDGTEIDESILDKRVLVNGVLGIYLESKINGQRLFFACVGLGAGESRQGRNIEGYYWSSTWHSVRYAHLLRINAERVRPDNNYFRYAGAAIRPVRM